jgi:hypothetical protein
MVQGIESGSERQLFLVIDATHYPGGTATARERREQHRDQQHQNYKHDQELQYSESALCGTVAHATTLTQWFSAFQ